jgi:hypothetical protein
MIARSGLTSRGAKKLLPSLAKFTPSGEASHPAPINAPVSAWVVEMGMPIRVASITVTAAANTTAREKLFSITILSGTKPLPVKVVSSS